MKRGQTALVCVLSGALLAPSAHAVADPGRNAYQTIADANPFRLKPIPVAVPVSVDPPKAPMSQLVLTGITDILGEKMALLEVQPPNNGKKAYLTLSEGQRDGDIEIVSIDEKAGVVQVVNQGTPLSLDFTIASKNVSASMPSATIPAATPGGAFPGVISTPKPAVIRTIRTSAAVTSGATPPGTATPALPSASVSVGGNPALAPAAAEAPLKPDEQIILMEINRELTKEKVANGELPPLPPTPLTPP
jgi:hypothetical protein